MAADAPPVGVLLLAKAGFGPRPGDLEAFEELAEDDESRLAAFLDRQLDPDSIDEDDLERRIERAGYESTELSRRRLWRNYRVNPQEGQSGDDPRRELLNLTMLRATYAEAQLFEVMADFWHNHFNVLGSLPIIQTMIMSYDQEVIRAHALGNFREMLGDVARSTTMLYYLDNYTSTSAGPNENWARELFELHTLGAEHYLGSGIRQADVEGFDTQPVGYVDDDVYEATRCFTGWTVDNEQEGDSGEFLYRREDHDRFQKTVLGAAIPADQPDLSDGETVLDLLANHPGTARYVSTKLCRRLVSDTPDEDLIESTAEVFAATTSDDDQIAQVVRHILESESFANSWGQKVKRPFDSAVSMLRAVEADLRFATDDDASQRFFNEYEQLGQPLFGWPAPDGYPDNAGFWLNTASMFGRWRLCNRLVADNDGRVLDRNFLAALDTENATAQEIVSFWTERLLQWKPPESATEPLVDFMAEGFAPDLPLGDSEETLERVRALIALILMMPEAQWK